MSLKQQQSQVDLGAWRERVVLKMGVSCPYLLRKVLEHVHAAHVLLVEMVLENEHMEEQPKYVRAQVQLQHHHHDSHHRLANTIHTRKNPSRFFPKNVDKTTQVGRWGSYVCNAYALTLIRRDCIQTYPVLTC